MKLKPLRIICIACIFVMLSALAASAQQLLANYNFETWTLTTVADNWTQYTTASGVTCYKGSTFSGSPSVTAHGGSECQRMKLNANGAQGGVYQRFASTAGNMYTVSVYILTRLTNTTQVEGKLGVDPTGATTPGANTVWSATVTGDSSWTQKTLSVTATGSYITVFLDGRHPTTDTSQCNVFFDDASATGSAPNPPTSGTAAANSPTQITWGWTRASGASGETYKAYDASSGGNLKWTSASQATSYSENGLTANTLYGSGAASGYQRHLATYQGSESTTRLGLPAKFTLANSPTYGTSGNVTIQCDHGQSNTGCTAGENITFTFNNSFGSGAANVGKFTYKWDTSSTWDGTSGTDWSSGSTLARQAGTAGTSYYLHLRSWNNDSVKAVNTTGLDLGPYTVPGAPVLLNGNFETWSGATTADNWTQYNLVDTAVCYKGSTWTGTPSVSAHGGSECQRVKLNAYNGEGGIYQRFNSYPGAQYTVSAWILTRVGSAYEAEAKLGVDPSGATTPGGNTVWSDKVIGDSGWIQKTINITATGSYVTIFLNGRHPHYDTLANGIFFDDATVTINSCTAPSAPTSSAATPSTTCFGFASILSASVGGGCTVDWYSGGCYGTYVGSGTSLGVAPTSTTTYYPRARNISTGCESTSCGTGVTVTVSASPAVPTNAIATPSTVAAGESSTLSATVDGGCTLDWYSGSCGGTLVGSGTSFSVNPGSTTTYYPRSRNTTTGCVNLSCGNAVTVVVSGAAGLTNSGFESWAGNTVADGWNQYTSTPGIACSKGSTFSGSPSVTAHGGSECQRVKLNASGAEGGVYQLFASTAGKQYTVSAYLLTRVTSAGEAVEAKLGVDTSGATTPGANTVWSSTVSGDSSWTAKSLSVTATGSYITIFLDGKHPNSTTNQVNVFFDDVALSAPVTSSIRYVKYHPTGTYNGQSWNTAFNNIQDAIDAAASGDEIWVASDTYAENLTLPSGVALYGGFTGTETARSQRNWTNNVTTIDGSSAGPVIEVARTASSSTRIDGFTITNGRAVLGGGIYCNQYANPVIINNSITGCHADCDGGGIFANLNSAPVIASNKIYNNGALYNGGGIRTQTGAATITNNTITCNGAASGGGIYVGEGSIASTEYIVNNTIYGNSAASGAGIGLAALSSAHISNNIIAYNTNGIRKSSGSGAPVLKKNDLYSNTDYNYSGLSAGATDISANPSLVSSTYCQVHIQPASACRNAGDNSEVIAGYADMDNQARIQNTTVDIGADESDGTTWSFTPVTVRVTTSGNDSNNGSSWAAAKRTIQSAINAAAANGGGEVWVKAGTYNETINLTDAVYVYGGFAGTETARAQRNWTSNVTVIDGGSAGPVVEAISLGNQLSAIDGFTIQNGKAWDGAGVLCMDAAPQVMNNTITSNAALGMGGGVCIINSAALVRVNDIKNNYALGYGGGVACLRGSAEISRDNIEDNWACVNGSGAYLSSSTTCRLVNNRIVKNHQCSVGTKAWGIGLSIDHYASPTIICNTIADNSGSYGVVYCGDYASGTINSNIVAYNGAGGFLGGVCFTTTRSYNCVYGNSGYNYSNIAAGTGDIGSDPLFYNRGGADYRITTGSPCKNAAETSTAPADDYLGVTRSTADIGCYEWQSFWGFSAPADGNSYKEAAAYDSRGGSKVPAFAFGKRVGPTNDEIELYTEWPENATGMKLYVSEDGLNWQPVGVEVAKGNGNIDSFQYGVARFVQTSSAYFAFRAVYPDFESEPGSVIHARPSEVEFGGVIVDSPQNNESGVSTVPELTWHPSWTQTTPASNYVWQVNRVTADNNWQLAWLVQAWNNPSMLSLVYGQTNGVRTFFAAESPLEDLAGYVCNVYAIDSENWAFAASSDTYFTTAGFDVLLK